MMEGRKIVFMTVIWGYKKCYEKERAKIGSKDNQESEET